MIILISRSGSTASKLLNQLSPVERNQVKVISNNFATEKLDSFFIHHHPIEFKKHKEIEEFLLEIEPTKILLIGYLRILSPDICNRHEIYNIHPADIVNHPELKGKDPVERIFEEDPLCEKYKRLGIVLHRVISEVDSGEILYFESFSRTNIEEAYKTLDEIALSFWKKLLQEG